MVSRPCPLSLAEAASSRHQLYRDQEASIILNPCILFLRSCQRLHNAPGERGKAAHVVKGLDETRIHQTVSTTIPAMVSRAPMPVFQVSGSAPKMTPISTPNNGEVKAIGMTLFSGAPLMAA